MGTRWLGLAVALGACGRIGFDQRLPENGDDARATDAPPVASCLAYSAAILCDDFETGLGAWFTVVDGANEVVRDTGFSRSGTASAHFLATESGSARLIATGLGDITSGTFHARYYQWVPSATVIENVSMLHVVSDVLPFPGLILIADTDGMYIQATIDSTFGPEVPMGVPRDKWVCIQATINVSTTGSAAVALDGIPSATFTGNTLPPPNGFSDIHIGAFLVQSQPVETWVDDVVVDRAPIPCD